MIDSDAVVNAAPNGRIFASFRHEPEVRGIRRPPPVYLTLNKLSYLILSYLSASLLCPSNTQRNKLFQLRRSLFFLAFFNCNCFFLSQYLKLARTLVAPLEIDALPSFAQWRTSQ